MAYLTPALVAGRKTLREFEGFPGIWRFSTASRKAKSLKSKIEGETIMDKPNIHISIEGFDGVGKTTICRLLTEKLGYEFVEKPLHFLFDEEGSFDEYIRVRDKVNACPNRDLTSFFYGLGSLYLYHLYDGKNIVTDRHLCSNFAWSGTQDNKDVYDLLLKKIGKPNLTVVLYANSKTIEARLRGRNCHDSDLKKVQQSEEIYGKMRKFCVENRLNTLWLHTDSMSPKRIVSLILDLLGGLHDGALECFREVSLVGGME